MRARRATGRLPGADGGCRGGRCAVPTAQCRRFRRCERSRFRRHGLRCIPMNCVWWLAGAEAAVDFAQRSERFTRTVCEQRACARPCSDRHTDRGVYAVGTASRLRGTAANDQLERYVPRNVHAESLGRPVRPHRLALSLAADGCQLTRSLAHAAEPVSAMYGRVRSRTHTPSWPNRYSHGCVDR